MEIHKTLLIGNELYFVYIKSNFRGVTIESIAKREVSAPRDFDFNKKENRLYFSVPFYTLQTEKYTLLNRLYFLLSHLVYQQKEKRKKAISYKNDMTKNKWRFRKESNIFMRKRFEISIKLGKKVIYSKKNLSQKEANILIEIDKALKNELSKPPEYIDEMCGEPINPPIIMLSPPNYELELKKESSSCKRCLLCSSKEVRKFLICSSSEKMKEGKAKA